MNFNGLRFTIARIESETCWNHQLLFLEQDTLVNLGFEIWCHPNDATQVWDKGL